MHAIILAPGPSLARYTPRPADLTLGVNRAATAFPVDVWACGDLPAIEQWHEKVIGTPLLLSYGVSLDNLNDRQWKWRGEVFRWSVMADQFIHTSVVNWPWSTFLAATTYAAFRGATDIQIYGSDWAGTLDFDGVAAGKNRSDDRWREEAGIFNALCETLKPRGVSITRNH